MSGKIKIDFDGKAMFTDREEDNIVQIAEKNGVYIPAPCYRNNKGAGCCRGCNVEICGKMRPACGTRVENGMKVIYDREDLVENRKKNILSYAQRIKDKEAGTHTSGGGCGCSK